VWPPQVPYQGGVAGKTATGGSPLTLRRSQTRGHLRAQLFPEDDLSDHPDQGLIFEISLHHSLDELSPLVATHSRDERQQTMVATTLGGNFISKDGAPQLCVSTPLERGVVGAEPPPQRKQQIKSRAF
jgi:hypothetical protein